VGTHSIGDVVLVEFSCYDPSLPPLAFSPLGSEGENKPSTLSLSACCRIVEEHGGRLLYSSNPGNTSYRMELRTATNADNRSSHTAFSAHSRAAARGTSSQ
jgi:hypothetical protein